MHADRLQSDTFTACEITTKRKHGQVVTFFSQMPNHEPQIQIQIRQHESYMSMDHHSPAVRVDVQSPQVYVAVLGRMVIALIATTQPLAISHYCQQMSAETFTTSSCFFW